MITTSVYYYKKELHTELATELNQLASSKNVQVSRWVNNSRGRQIVTYIVHTGERNQFASKQENVLFKTTLDAGRGNRVMDEQNMMAEVRQYLNNLTVDEPETETITGFWFSDDDAIAGEPQFVTDIDEQYIACQEIFGDEFTDTREEFENRWQLITASEIADGFYPYSGEQFRENLRNDVRFCYFPEITQFVEIEMAKYDD